MASTVVLVRVLADHRGANEYLGTFQIPDGPFGKINEVAGVPCVFRDVSIDDVTAIRQLAHPAIALEDSKLRAEAQVHQWFGLYVSLAVDECAPGGNAVRRRDNVRR